MHVAWALLQHSQLQDVLLAILPVAQVFGLRRVSSKLLEVVNSYVEHQVDNVLCFTREDALDGRKPIPTSRSSYLKLVASNFGPVPFERSVLLQTVNWDLPGFMAHVGRSSRKPDQGVAHPLLGILLQAPPNSGTHRIILPVAASAPPIYRSLKTRQFPNLRTFVHAQGKLEDPTNSHCDDFCEFIRSSPKIETLHISGFKGFNTTKLMTLLSNVTSLDVSHTGICDDDLKVLATVNRGKLVELVVSYTSVTDDGIDALLSEPNSSFKSFVAHRTCIIGPMLSDACVDRVLTQSTKTLVELSMSARYLSNTAFASLTMCSNLERLELQFCKSESAVQPDTIFLADLSNLQSLQLSGCQHHQILQEVQILAQNRNGKNLEIVSLMGSAVTDDILTSLVVHCPLIRFLDIEDCSKVTGASLRAASKCAHRLTFLSVKINTTFDWEIGGAVTFVGRQDVKDFKAAQPRCVVLCMNDDETDSDDECFW